MAAPISRTDFKNYCLRKLGAPVIEINVADEQLEDRIDEGLQKWSDYHFDGSSRYYWKHKITQEDIDRQYIVVSDEYIGIERILPPISTKGISGMFSFKYQYMMNDMPYLTQGNMNNFAISMSNLDLIDEMFNSRGQNIRFNRHTDKLFLDLIWPGSESNQPDIRKDDFIIIVGHKKTDPTEYPDVWNDMWLKKYCTELFRYQWGSNLIKLQGVALPGGVTLNGEVILSEAKENLDKLDEEMQLNYQLPDDFFVA
tara:strand:+ start:2515 stop:3279 length:765 start_codon:yes stop_codon:yes gene_type:complete